MFQNPWSRLIWGRVIIWPTHLECSDVTYLSSYLFKSPTPKRKLQVLINWLLNGQLTVCFRQETSKILLTYDFRFLHWKMIQGRTLVPPLKNHWLSILCLENSTLIQGERESKSSARDFEVCPEYEYTYSYSQRTSIDVDHNLFSQAFQTTHTYRDIFSTESSSVVVAI